MSLPVLLKVNYPIFDTHLRFKTILVKKNRMPYRKRLTGFMTQIIRSGTILKPLAAFPWSGPYRTH